MATFVGNWTYLGDHSIPRDAVRSEIGDVNPDDKLISDERIATNLTNNDDNVLLAAARCAMQLFAQFSREADKTIDGAEGRSTTVHYSQRAANFKALAKTLLERAQEAIGAGPGGTVTPIPHVGGVSQARKDTVNSDSDRIAPAFSMGLFE